MAEGNNSQDFIEIRKTVILFVGTFSMAWKTTAHLGTSLSVLVILLLGVQQASTGKVLMMGMQYSSHLNEFAAVGEALVNNGHEVYMVMDEHYQNPKQFKGTGVKFLYYESPIWDLVDNARFDRIYADALLRLKESAATLLSKYTTPRFTHECNITLRDPNLLMKIKQIKFDVALVEGLYFCYHWLPYKFDIPYITMSSAKPAFLLRLHPVVTTMPCLVNENTFFKILNGFLTSMFMSYMLPNMIIDPSQFENYAPEKPLKSHIDIYMRSSLWLINKNAAIDCASPSSPNVIDVGGLTNKPAKPLPADYEKIIKNAKDGVIIMSFGSSLSILPEDLVEKLVLAFGKLKQTVIWRLNNKLKIPVPANIKLVSWMPQNDLLGHSNVKLFITHCGNNGIAEAIYHGKPMLGFPIFGDQLDNSFRAAVKGMAIKMDIHDFTQEELVENVNELLTNSKYTIAARKASAIQKSLPSPQKTSVFWIEHILEHGGDHLRTTLQDMNVFQFLMLDIIFFITFIFFMIVLIVWLLIRCLYRNIVKKKPADKKQKTQ